MHRHAIRARPQRTNRHARSVHFHLRLAGTQGPKRHRAGRDLYLETFHIHGGESNFRIRTNSNHVGGIQLDFSARGGAGEQPVVRHERRIQGCSHHVARIAAPHRDVAIQNADARDGTPGFVLAVGIGIGAWVVLGSKRYSIPEPCNDYRDNGEYWKNTFHRPLRFARMKAIPGPSAKWLKRKQLGRVGWLGRLAENHQECLG